MAEVINKIHTEDQNYVKHASMIKNGRQIMRNNNEEVRG